jgi:hypothetical protein
MELWKNRNSECGRFRKFRFFHERLSTFGKFLHIVEAKFASEDAKIFPKTRQKYFCFPCGWDKKFCKQERFDPFSIFKSF